MQTIEYLEATISAGEVAAKLNEAAKDGWLFVAWLSQWRDPYGQGRCREVLLSRPFEEPKKKHR